jgi:hypothetical protein
MLAPAFSHFLIFLMHPVRLLALGMACLLSCTIFTSQAQTCAAVTNLVTTPLSGSSVSVSATPAVGATDYIIVCTIYPVATGVIFNSVSTPTPAYTFTGLPANTPYIICINATCGAGQQQGSACSPKSGAALATHNATLATQVALFPNPAHATTTLALPTQLQVPGASATLVNALGQVVRQRTLPGRATTEFDLTGLAPGVYSVKLQAGEDWVAKRLVIY